MLGVRYTRTAKLLSSTGLAYQTLKAELGPFFDMWKFRSGDVTPVLVGILYSRGYQVV